MLIESKSFIRKANAGCLSARHLPKPMRNQNNKCRWQLAAIKTFVVVALIFFARSAMCASEGDFMGFQLTETSPIRGLTIPLCAESTSIPSARVFIEEICIEKRRFGNLILGITPRYVIRGMKLEILDQKDANRCWAYLCNFVTKEVSVNLAEINGFEILQQDKEAPVVKAVTAGFNVQDATLQLVNVSLFKKGHLVKSLKSATIPLSGSQAGELVWKNGSDGGNLTLVPPKSNDSTIAATAPLSMEQPVLPR